jgi:hypothetical protein
MSNKSKPSAGGASQGIAPGLSQAGGRSRWRHNRSRHGLIRRATGIGPDVVTLKMQSTRPSKGIFHEVFEDWAKKVNGMSGGRLKTDTLPAGAVVPAFSTRPSSTIRPPISSRASQMCARPAWCKVTTNPRVPRTPLQQGQVRVVAEGSTGHSQIRRDDPVRRHDVGILRPQLGGRGGARPETRGEVHSDAQSGAGSPTESVG